MEPLDTIDDHIDLAAHRSIEPRMRELTMYERRIKPVVDRLGATALLILLSPVLVVVALAVMVRLGRPVLYRQTRVGQDGVPFEMLKFRTMERDRRRRRSGDYDGPERRRRHKTPDDPRHTRLGMFLRRYSLDELPQLWNVLRGELSLIGPRPELLTVVQQYEQWQHRRHAVKPGVTGLWQVTERDHDGLMHLHVGTDLDYIDRLSPRLDLWIFAMTIPAVLGLKMAGAATERAREGAPADSTSRA